MAVGMIGVSGCCQGGGSGRQSREAAGAFIWPWQGHEVVGLPGTVVMPDVTFGCGLVGVCQHRYWVVWEARLVGVFVSNEMLELL